MEKLSMHESLNDDEIDFRELLKLIRKYRHFLWKFVFSVMIFAILWVISLPNNYQSYAVLVPQDQSSGTNLGGLSALAGIAGIDIGGTSMSPDEGYMQLLNNYDFMYAFLRKNHFDKEMTAPKVDENYVFVFDSRVLYNWKKSVYQKIFPIHPIEQLSEEKQELMRYRLIERLKKKISISADKKTATIIITCTDPDREFAQKLLNAFLREASEALMKTDVADLDKKIAYYKNEIDSINDINIKNQLSQLMTALIQTKVQADASEYYNVKIITRPGISYIRDKVEPKRGIILGITFILSIIIGLFVAFLIEFIKREK